MVVIVIIIIVGIIGIKGLSVLREADIFPGGKSGAESERDASGELLSFC